MRSLASLLAGTAIAALSATPQRAADEFFTRLKTTTDTAWLERVAGEDGVAETVTPNMYSSKSVREMAYVRLGAIGTAEAIAAARRIEAAARAWSPVSPSVSLDRLPHPASHFSDYDPRPFTRVAGPGGVTFAVIALQDFGGSDVFLTTSRTPELWSDWSRPLLLANRAPFGIKDPVLTWSAEGTLRLEFSAVTGNDSSAALHPFGRPAGAPPTDRQSWEIVVAAVRRDTDGDGWTDIEEERLGTDRTRADSDGDGLDDGADVCPNYAASPAESTDVEASILRKVFFAAYGIHRSHYVLVVKGNSRPLQLWGSFGPVLYGIDRSGWQSRWSGAPPELSWKLTALKSDPATGDTATVTFGDFEGAMAAAGYTATLRKIDGEWFVTSITMNWIS